MGLRKPLWRAGEFETAIAAPPAVTAKREEYKALLQYGLKLLKDLPAKKSPIRSGGLVRTKASGVRCKPAFKTVK
ncbi:hypothetical protein D4R54_01780 [archaeon]|nr:MAG: hypothetical protein D4R54_01780 [archaeon]